MGAKTNNVAIFLMTIIKNSWIDWSITRALFVCIDTKFIGITYIQRFFIKFITNNVIKSLGQRLVKILNTVFKICKFVLNLYLRH